MISRTRRIKNPLILFMFCSLLAGCGDDSKLWVLNIGTPWKY